MHNPPSRIIQLDCLRGLMLVIMMLNHLRYFPMWSINDKAPWVAHFTFQPLGFFTAAEGFVFLSGLIFAIVYTPRFQKEGLRAFDFYVVHRFLYIYKWHIGTYALVIGLFLIPLFNANWPYNWESQEMIKKAPVQMLLRAMVLLHQPGLLDILPLYLCFILFIPLVMRGLINGRSGTVLMLMVLVWGIAQFRPQIYIESHAEVHLGWFEALAWQVIFFSGFVLGYHFRSNNLHIPIKREWVIPASLFCVLFFFYRHQLPAQFDAPPDSIAALINDRGLGAIRILNMAAMVYLLYAVCQWKPSWFRNSILVSLGQHSIQVFSLHILVCYLAMPWRPWFAELSLATQLLWMFALTLTLYLPVLVWRKHTNPQRQ